MPVFTINVSYLIFSRVAVICAVMGYGFLSSRDNLVFKWFVILSQCSPVIQ